MTCHLFSRPVQFPGRGIQGRRMLRFWHMTTQAIALGVCLCESRLLEKYLFYTSMFCDLVCHVQSVCMSCSPLCWFGPRFAYLSVKSVGRKTQLKTTIRVIQIPHEMRGRMSSLVGQESARGLVCESTHSGCLVRWWRISYSWSRALSLWELWTWGFGVCGLRPHGGGTLERHSIPSTSQSQHTYEAPRDVIATSKVTTTPKTE